MRPVLRRLFLAVTGVFFLVGPSLADDAAGRYALSASRDGFVRLDTATGAVSHCRQTSGVWRCEPLATDNARLEALAADVAKLRAGLAALDARVAALPTVAKTEDAIPPSPVATVPPTDDGPNVMRQTLSRLLHFVWLVKHGRAGPA